MMAQIESSQAVCSNPNCHSHNLSIVDQRKNDLKACAACGVVSYCSKECQKRDWGRHKKICISFRPVKVHVSKLQVTNRSVLNSMSLDLPSIADEYQRRFSPVGINMMHQMFSQGGLEATRDMVSNSIRNLMAEDDDASNMLKRWQEISPMLDRFIQKAELGDVFKEKVYHPYSPGAPQQFRNTPLRDPTAFKHGTTVVDIGFVDFGISFDSVDSVHDNNDPITILGYDMDPFCVAKSIVMHKMMKDKTVTARSIVEVWLNSLWSKKTLGAFKRATKTIVCDNSENLPNEVKKIVKYWDNHKKMSSTTALNFQMQANLQQSNCNFAMKCCSLSSEQDRVEYLRYFLTKALYEDETTIVGSIVMNSVNEKIGVKQLFADCFELAPPRIHCESDPSFISNSTVVNRTKSYFINSMKKYMSFIRNGTLVFIPKLGLLSENNHSMISEIKAAKPYMISWSNVVDYVHPNSFHKIAKQVSCQETAHYFHSCNWSSRVMGTDIFDFARDGRIDIFSSGLAFIESSLLFHHGFTKQGTFHFRDVCSPILGRRFVHKFFQYFFQNETVNCSCFNGNTPLKLMYPFARSVDTTFIIFAYKDTGITFGADTYDYFKSY